MSDINIPGFQSSEVLVSLAKSFDGASEAEKKQMIKKTNGIFEIRVTNSENKEAIWTIDLKKDGTVTQGPAKPKPDVTLIFKDDIFVSIANGKLDAQKAFLTGKLKTKGNIMLATKLDAVLSASKARAKL